MSSGGHEWTIRSLAETVADTERLAGGGVVAAMSLTGAAATVELVIQLSRRRTQITADQSNRLEDLQSLTQSLRESFLAAIDADIASLTSMMDAQRELRRARNASREDVVAAEERAASAIKAALETPLSVARQGDQLLQVIDEARWTARKFTLSDLGAAAATTCGAIESLLLMAEVNLGLVRDESFRDANRHEIDELFQRAREQSEIIVSATRSTIQSDRS